MPPAKQKPATLILPDGDPRLLRLRLGLEIDDWARILGVAILTARRWEHGTPPSGLASEVLRGLARALESGAEPAEIRSRINLGLGSFVALALTTSKTGKRP